MAIQTATPHWEYRDIALPRGTSRESARQLMTGAAETGRWELAQSRIFRDGRRSVRLRRRIYRVVRTA